MFNKVKEDGRKAYRRRIQKAGVKYSAKDEKEYIIAYVIAYVTVTFLKVFFITLIGLLLGILYIFVVGGMGVVFFNAVVYLFSLEFVTAIETIPENYFIMGVLLNATYFILRWLKK